MTTEIVHLQKPDKSQPFEQIISEGIYIEDGNKRLHVVIILPEAIALTRIETIEGEVKIAGSTTRLYSSALAIMQEVATGHSLSMSYNFYTENENLRLWALDPDKGRSIFQWDYLEDDGISVAAVKIINPRMRKS